MRPVFFVYLVASISGTLYIGMTDDLPLRMAQHKRGAYDGFTKKYKVDRLMYYEVLDDSQRLPPTPPPVPEPLPFPLTPPPSLRSTAPPGP